MPAYPVPLEMPEIVGLFVGGCIRRGDGSSFRHRAHAHVSKADEWRGWVCVRSPKRLSTPSGRPSRLMWHEYAHITTGHGHDAIWRARITEYGFPAEAKRYIRPVRQPFVYVWWDPSGTRYEGTHREMVAAQRGAR